MSAFGTAGSLAGTIAAGLSYTNRKKRQNLRDMQKQYEAGTLGPSMAERDQWAQGAAQQAGVAQAQQNQMMAQQLGGTPQQGKAIAVQGQLAQNTAMARSQASNQANIAGAQMAEAKRQELFGRQAQQAQQNLASGQQIGQQAGELLPYAIDPIARAVQNRFNAMQPYAPWSS